MFSKWHKIDLHIHTDKSKETKENDYECIFSLDVLLAKLRENDVDLFSLTDHNIINIDAYDKLTLKKAEYFVGVELDTAINSEDLIEYVTKLGSDRNIEKIKFKPFHIIVLFKSRDHVKLSEKLESMYGNISTNILRNSIDLSKRKKLRVTTLEILANAFIDEDYFIISHGNKDKGIVRPNKEADLLIDAQYEILFGEISALEMKSHTHMTHVIGLYNEGFKKLIQANFQKEDTTSYVVFSDNHNCDNYALKEFQTWIKGDFSYETLRLSFSDPSSRIFTSKKKPTHTPNYIDKMMLGIKNNDVAQIEFSPYLNVIIGGRSSGKSLLFNTLLGLNTFIDRDDLKLYSSIYTSFIDTSTTKIKDINNEMSSKISVESEAYYQEKIIELFREGNALKTKLSIFFEEFNDAEITSEELKIELLFSKLASSYKAYYDTRKNIETGSVTGIVKQANQETNKLFEVDESFYIESDLDDYKNAISTISQSIKEIETVSQISIYGDKLFSESESDVILNSIQILTSKLDYVRRKMNAIKMKNLFSTKVKLIVEKYIREELAQEHQQIEHAKDKLNNDIIKYSQYFKAKIKLKKACNEIESISIKIPDKINNCGKYSFVSKLNFEIDKNIILDELFIQNINNFNPSNSIFENLSCMVESSNDIRIKRKTTDGKYPEALKNKIDEFVKSKKSKKEYIIMENTETPISSDLTSQGKKASMFLDIKLNSFIDQNTQCVLLVDQIEDNIDNKYIGEDLVGLIRVLKKQMQIILVTHNPSIAIYGDAENIIIADNIDGKYSFTQGGLEKEEIRKEACRILDGGDIAFKNRMDKYNIAKIK